MSRVSITGAKRVLDDVIETTHELNLLHVTDYDGAWEGFEPGNPIAGADEAAERLVTVRALESILDLDDDRTEASERIDTDHLADRLDRVRTAVNEIDDRRDALRDERRTLDERADAMTPLSTLGIDLDLLAGYDSLETRVGEGDEGSVRAALDAAGTVDRYETFAENGVIAVFARPTAGSSDVLEDAVVGAEFAAIEVPDAETSPDVYLDDLDDRRTELDDEIHSLEAELDDLRAEHADFLLAAEEQLTIAVEKREIPLAFATTQNAFVAEGWLPTAGFVDLAAALDESVGDHCEVEELERAAYDGDGRVTERESPETTDPEAGVPETAADGGDDTDAGGLEPLDADDGLEPDGGESPRAARSGADGRSEARPEGAPRNGERRSRERSESDGGEREPRRSAERSDGGTETRMGSGEPPVIQQNPGITKPFELLTRAVGRPSYSELDPTIVLFLTFPAFFGFMVADAGYGLVYMLIGWYLYSQFDSDGLTSIGFVAATAGFFTAVFGVLFGEIFGLHLISQYLWEPLIGGPPVHKGLEPATSAWARAWFLVTALVGVLHLDIAYVFEFIEDYELHGVKEAMLHSGSWLLALNGLWLFILSRLFEGAKPDLLFEVFGSGERTAIELGFTGLPAWAGVVGVAMILVGLGLLAVGPTYELVEFHTILAHPLSYLRVSAELLAEVGLAFAVNLLFFGAYATEGEHGAEWHFGLGGVPEVGSVHHGHEVVEILSPGLVHQGLLLALLGVVVLIVGNLIVLALGVMSVGIQAIRLEYFEFFSKFYEGNGITYDPFGAEKRFSTDE